MTLQCQAASGVELEKWITAISAFAHHVQRHTKKQKRTMSVATPSHVKVDAVDNSSHSLVSSIHDYLTLKSVSNKKVIHVILVRHGHYVNAHSEHALDSDQVLSLLGKQQAEHCGRHLHQMYASRHFRNDVVRTDKMYRDMNKHARTFSMGISRRSSIYIYIYIYQMCYCSCL